MAETAPAPVATPAKVAKKKVGLSASELVVKAVTASKERGGVSLAALKKSLSAGGYDVEKNNARVKNAIKSLVAKEVLLQTKGTGASGSFKINKKAEPKAVKPAAKKAAPKVKKVVAKKPAAAKKSAVAKKSPKKVKKPSAVKKAVKSPKKVVKKVPAAKKVIAKKTAKPKAKKATPKKK